MKIKGYIPPDKEIGQEIGVEAEYYTEFGRIFARIKHTGTDNVSFRAALDKQTRQNDVRAKTGFVLPADDARKEWAALYFDHAIISWNTEIVDEDVDPDAPIKPSRETFIKLMGLDLFDAALAQLMRDCEDRKLFIKEAEVTAAKK